MVVKIKRFINKLKMKKTLIVASSLLAPALLFAQVVVDNFKDLLHSIGVVINWVIPVVVALAVLVVIWGAFQFVVSAGDPEKRKEGKDKIIWGIVGVVVILSIWGLIGFLASTFDLGGTVPNVPTVPVIAL
ncbi:MAG: hypothetical protein A3J04_04180 [Candidatus Ryanbacteria bacterium RIFCSPLOWO2_02_FULL_47_14]|uniref:Cardiolipin synthase N-terminal domain-containing protein n=1 Tax=Candidatus Ryanbacteria bacterium RIFCSPLOWO2_02_FULL_47_14 TaxID=1802129 RepID=A0A1G2GZT9_9BACT|nr:MAG: hypothetical protein A3J04_04180 [Candidatus Ryanbacteria bacterium RIFCSPLOWO2_02_FULL_47_14]